MPTEVTVIAATECLDTGASLYTLLLTYPRFIHAELMTHRAFSRNAASSRAIPIAKMIARVRDNLAAPTRFGGNQPGMQDNGPLPENQQAEAMEIWRSASEAAIFHTEKLARLGVHKQQANRLLEPYMHMETLVTATEWENFFQLRYYDAAGPDPTFYELASKIHAAITGDCYAIRQVDRQMDFVDTLHLPFIRQSERLAMDEMFKPLGGNSPQHIAALLAVSAARCGRISYLNHAQNKPTLGEELQTFAKFATTPLHASPLEHQAWPMPLVTNASRNFRGFVQFREAYEQLPSLSTDIAYLIRHFSPQSNPAA